MSSAAVRIQAGTRLIYDGDAAQVVELLAAQSGVNVVLRVNPDHLVYVPLREPKQLFKYGVQALKGLGWFGGPLGAGAVAALGGTIAASITYGFGWACNAYYKSGMEMDLGELGEIYQEQYKQYYNRKKDKETVTV